MNWALSQDAGSPSAKLVLLILANRANQDGKCWPGFNGIAEQTELSRRTVVTQVQKLVDAGLISVTQRPKQQSNLYTLNMNCTSAAVALRSETVAPPVVQQLHQGSATVAPEPSLTIIEPKLYRAAKRVPADWCLSESTYEFALSVGMDESELDDQLGQFCDHEFKTARKDWDACWRTWCRNWKKWSSNEAHKRTDDYGAIHARNRKAAGLD